jgi:hypothetical protein
MSRREQPWLRLYTNILENPKVQRLRPDVFRAWVNLLALYKRSDEVMPPIDEIAFSLRSSEKDVRKWLAELVKVGLLDETSDGLVPHNWDDRQFNSDTSKERQRAYRERLKARNGDAQSDAVVTSLNGRSDVTVTAVVTTQDTDTDTDTDTEPPVVPQRGTRRIEPPPEFVRFREVYPDRAGDQNWRRALHACQARIAEGHTWTELLDGAERYARFIESTGKLGTEYVKQAATFCGPDKPFLNPWIPPRSKAESRTATNLAGITEWLNS